MFSQYYSPQANLDRVNNQINELEKIKNQIQSNMVQTPNINQTFQITPNQNTGIKYANSVEDVMKELVYYETPFFSNDLSTLWIKNTKGDINTYKLEKVVVVDEKDLIINSLKNKIKELERSIANESNDEYVDESTKSKKSSNISKNSTNNAK